MKCEEVWLLALLFSYSHCDSDDPARPIANVTFSDIITNVTFSDIITNVTFNEITPLGFNTINSTYKPYGPLVLCSFLPDEFIECDNPIDHFGNKTLRDELGYGCIKFGGNRYEDVEHGSVLCTALPLIECYGNRTFIKHGIPCIRYGGHFFLTTLLYSILLGALGMDRFYMGQTGTAIGKLVTLGGLGVWWIVDIVLLITNNLQPDGLNWNVNA